MLKTYIAGGYGFLGQHIFLAFEGKAYRDKKFNLTNTIDAAQSVSGVDMVINAAGRTAGILANQQRPADLYLQNLITGTFLMEAARQAGCKKFIQIGTVCSYPKNIPTPMQEDHFWNGYPEKTNAAYGLAKKALVVQAQAYRKQYGFMTVNPILANLYGPGDHYELEVSHVIPALIVKMLDAAENKDPFVVLWGTGKCTRDFLFVEDAAQAIKLLADTYESSEIINVASGRETSIRDVAESVATACNFKGDLRWDSSKPDGQPRRVFDIHKISQLGWSAKTSLKNGILAAVEDCKQWRLKHVAA